MRIVVFLVLFGRGVVPAWRNAALAAFDPTNDPKQLLRGPGWWE